MGYRYVLRRFTYQTPLRAGGKLAFTTWWENQGVAPSYRQFPVVLRLSGAQGSAAIQTAADIRQWLPGDAIYDDSVTLPADLRPGLYELSIGIVDPATGQPKVKLAIAGVTAEGWYPLGKIEIHE